VLGFALLAMLSIGIFVLPVAMAAIVVLAARQVPGAPLLLAGVGLVTAPFTLFLWLRPGCQSGFSRIGPGGREVARCLEYADRVAWPFAVSSGLVLVGVILFWATRPRSGSGGGPASGPASAGKVGTAYVVLVAALVGFGIFDLIAIGPPFLVLGLLLAGLAPFRGRPELFWPPLAAVLFLFVGFLLVAPFGCTATAVAPSTPGAVGVSRTVCTNLLGLDYSGGAGYQPSYLPGILAGIGTGTVAGVVTWSLIRRARGGARVGGA